MVSIDTASSPGFNLYIKSLESMQKVETYANLDSKAM